MRVTKDPYDPNFAHDMHAFVIKMNGTPLMIDTLLWADDVTGEVAFLKRDGSTREYIMDSTVTDRNFPETLVPVKGAIEIIVPAQRTSPTPCNIKNLKASAWWTR